jgi:hypothetical protein
MVEVNTLKQTINSTFGRSDEFSESFWRFIREVVGIKYIYKHQSSYLKKPVPFEERKRKIDELLERADFDDDKLSPSDHELTKW